MITIIYSEAYKDQAAHRIRVIEPLELLAAANKFRCLPLESLSPAEIIRGDILYLFIMDVHTLNLDKMAPILDAFLHCRKPVVSNLDDLYFNIPKTIMMKEGLEKNSKIFEHLIRVSHLVLVTGKYLKDHVIPFNPRVAVIPNMIDHAAFPLRKGGNKRLHIGWCGLPTHFADLSLVIPVIKKLRQRYPVDFTIFGLFTEPMNDLIANVQKLNLDRHLQARLENEQFIANAVQMANALDGVDFRHVPLVPYSQFPRTLAELNFDIGLCPLIDTPFNRCKSAVKFAQYAAVNTVTAASNVYPYSAECNYLVENTPGDWYGKIARLIEDETFRGTVLQQQRDFILSNRSYQTGLTLFESLFNKIAPRH